MLRVEKAIAGMSSFQLSFGASINEIAERQQKGMAGEPVHSAFVSQAALPCMCPRGQGSSVISMQCQRQVSQCGARCIDGFVLPGIWGAGPMKCTTAYAPLQTQLPQYSDHQHSHLMSVCMSLCVYVCICVCVCVPCLQRWDIACKCGTHRQATQRSV